MSPARLCGWRRSWSARGFYPEFGKIVALSASPCKDGSSIEGLVATIPHIDDWLVLEKREAGYERLSLESDKLRLLQPERELKHASYIYQVQHEKEGAAEDDYVILQSYIDAVLQGYIRQFGFDGAQRFFATTDGWDGQIFDDRHKPVYPRSIRLLDHERDFIDTMLEKVSAARPK